MASSFAGGRNLALKVPPHEHRATVAFYRDVLGLEELPSADVASPRFRFGANVLWIDAVATVSQAELWLELTTDDTAAAAARLAEAGVVRCDAIEPLPDDLDGFWIASPCGVVHLVCRAGEDPTRDAGG